MTDKPFPLDPEGLERMRALAVTTKRSGRGVLGSHCYYGQGDVAVPSAWLIEIIDQLRRPYVRYKYRPPGFVEERKKHCTTPHLCFEFGDSAPVCGPCDAAACEALTAANNG